MEIRLIPRGVPGLGYVRVLSDDIPNGPKDLLMNGNSINILENDKVKNKFEFTHILNEEFNDQEVCENIIGEEAGASFGTKINPVAAYIHDAVTVVIFIIGSRQAKKTKFLKQVFLPFLAEEIHEILSDKTEETTGFHDFDVEVSGFEIQNEIITDLQQPSNRNSVTSVEFSVDDGMTVPSLLRQKINFSDQSQLQVSLDRLCGNRGAQNLPPGASIDTSTAVFDIELLQREGTPGSTSGQAVLKVSKSRFIVVDLPTFDSATSLASASTYEDPALHKSLAVWTEVTRRLALQPDSTQQTHSRPAATTAPFRASKLTHFLSELLGGNALLLSLATVCQGEGEVSRRILEATQTLTQIVQYPVGGRDFSDIVRGLMTKYRAMIAYLQDEIEGLRANGETQSVSGQDTVVGTVYAPGALEKKVSDLQQELLQRVQALQSSQQDAAKLLEMLELLKQKYNTLVDLKTKQTEELLRVEEEKLALAKSFVEFKLKSSEDQEALEREKYEISVSLLMAQQEVSQLQTQMEETMQELSTQTQRIGQLEAEMKSEKERNISATSSLREVKIQLERESEKNLDIGSELLTLVNQKDVLQHKCQDLEKTVKDLNFKLKSCQDLMQGEGSSTEKLSLDLKTVSEQLAQANREKMEAELNLKAMKIQMERSKLDFDRMANDFLRDRDDALTRAKRSAENELNRLRADHEDLIIQLPRSQRLTRDVERDLQRARSDLEASIRQKTETEAELAALRQSYRTKIAGIADASVSSTDGDGVIQELAGTFVDNEKRILHILRQNDSQSEAMRTAHRLLFDKYREALDLLEDNAPSMLPVDIITEEKLNQAMAQFPRIEERQPMTESMSSPVKPKAQRSSSSLDEKDKKEPRKSIRSSSKNQTEDELLAEQARFATIVATYKKNLERNENEKEALVREVGSLRESNKMLQEQLAAGQEILSMERKVLQQIEDVKDKQQSDDGKKPLQMIALQAQKQLDEENRDLRARLQQKEDELTREKLEREKEKEELKASALLASATMSTVGTSEPSDGAAENVNQSQQAPPDQSALLQQYRELEKKNVALSSKNASLEEELKNYKVYMKDTVSQYKKQIQALKGQLQGK